MVWTEEDQKGRGPPVATAYDAWRQIQPRRHAAERHESRAFRIEKCLHHRKIREILSTDLPVRQIPSSHRAKNIMPPVFGKSVQGSAYPASMKRGVMADRYQDVDVDAMDAKCRVQIFCTDERYLRGR
jgi:hypothetical protein